MNLCQDCARLTASQFVPYMFAKCDGDCHRAGLLPVAYIPSESLRDRVKK